MDMKLIIIFCVTGIVVLVTLIFGVMGCIAFARTEKGSAKSFGLMFQRGNFLRIATVIMIVLSVLFLSLMDILKENGIISLFSGIAGYVLGGLDRNKDGNDAEAD
jgi:Ca2+/Na+ antiporter